MALLTEENNQTHQVVQINTEAKTHCTVFYGSRGECEQHIKDIPAASDLDYVIEKIDTTDPRNG